MLKWSKSEWKWQRCDFIPFEYTVLNNAYKCNLLWTLESEEDKKRRKQFVDLKNNFEVHRCVASKPCALQQQRKRFFFCIYNLFKVFIYLTSWIFHLKKVTLSCPLLAVLLFTQCTQGRSSWVASTSVQVISALWRRTSPFLVQEGGGAPFVYPSFLPFVTAHTGAFSPLCDGGSVS